MNLNKNIAISDTGFIFNPANGDSFSTNGVATDIILLLKESKGEEEIKEFLFNKYDVDRSTVERDFDEFILELKDQYLMS